MERSAEFYRGALWQWSTSERRSALEALLAPPAAPPTTKEAGDDPA